MTGGRGTSPADGTAEAYGIERLLRAVQELSMATRLSEVQQVVRSAARDLAGCDGATFVLRDGDLCYYADEDAIAPLWKGMRFPMESCISGWAMLNRQHAVIADIYEDPRIPHEAYRPTFVKSLVMTPVRTMSPIGAIGAYWADPHDATEQEVALLRALADATSLALEKVSIHRELEQEVALAQEAHRLSLTDPLTGLLNRRGFTEEVDRVVADPSGAGGAVAFVDVDGLKAINDTHGHSAGDRLIAAVAHSIRGAVRADDVVGRLGGDEFAVFASHLDPDLLEERLVTALGTLASVGTAPLRSPGELPDALLAADVEMYAAKRKRMLYS
ncbi:diguanylate cyclase [Nocardioides silvaticus]|uniref:Diguanylate cyclase n=1 Tax=Nocardioides silvaticus TaxID=2201891 RepID=A0A316TRT5_9ACTN|nr:sensor domain-containing diguanylate cyclase [Nocardioides silvaticus]PWN02346.1 diguanylate cyclase [Nocardioides silvaticus]